jgi:hypothetical protein
MAEAGYWARRWSLMVVVEAEQSRDLISSWVDVIIIIWLKSSGGPCS